MHFEPVFRAPLLCLLASVIIPLAFVPKHNVCAIRRASELVLLVRMYYATPAPPPVGDLGPEFESGLDLVLKKKTPLDHFTLEKKTNVEIIRPLHVRDYLRRLVGGQRSLVALTRVAAREYEVVRDGGGDTKCLAPRLRVWQCATRVLASLAESGRAARTVDGPYVETSSTPQVRHRD